MKKRRMYGMEKTAIIDELTERHSEVTRKKDELVEAVSDYSYSCSLVIASPTKGALDEVALRKDRMLAVFKELKKAEQKEGRMITNLLRC